MYLIILLRLIGPLFILRYPLAGALIAIGLDFIDYKIIINTDPQNFVNYQQLDKVLDFYYLSLELYVALSWNNLKAKIVAFTLFIYRTIGIVAFELTGLEPILVVFPNIFELFYLIYAFQLTFFKKDYFLSTRIAVLTILILLVPKIFHEYLLHINKIQPWDNNYYVQRIKNPDLLREVFAK